MPSSSPFRPGEIRKILAVKLRQLGDTVIMTAALKELHRLFPAAEIQVVVSNAWVPILHHTPGVTRVWPHTRHSDTSARVKALTRLGLKLRKEKFDLVVNLHASPSSALLSFSTGARIRSVHFHGHKDKNRFSTVEIPNKGKLLPITERDLDAVRALGYKIPAGILPQIFLQPRELQRGAQLLGLPPTTAPRKTPILVIGLGASRPTKCWPFEYFAQVAKAWCEHFGDAKIVCVGSKEEADLLLQFSRVFSEAAPQFQNRLLPLTQLRIRELAAVLAHGRVFLGNDSGPKHISVAVGTPTVTLFGPENPFEWHPYPKDRHPYFFIENLPCRKDAFPGMPEWCSLAYCEEEAHKCMRMIEPKTVFEKCLELSKENLIGGMPS